MSDQPYVPWLSFDLVGKSPTESGINVYPERGKTQLEYAMRCTVISPKAAVGFLLKCIGSRLGDQRGYSIRRNALRRMYDHKGYRKASRRYKTQIRRTLMAREL